MKENERKFKEEERKIIKFHEILSNFKNEVKKPIILN